MLSKEILMDITMIACTFTCLLNSLAFWNLIKTIDELRDIKRTLEIMSTCHGQHSKIDGNYSDAN